MDDFKKELEELEVDELMESEATSWDIQEYDDPMLAQYCARRCGFRCFGCFSCFRCYSCYRCYGCARCYRRCGYWRG